jgi:hypothetical protein
MLGAINRTVGTHQVSSARRGRGLGGNTCVCAGQFPVILHLPEPPRVVLGAVYLPVFVSDESTAREPNV